MSRQRILKVRNLCKSYLDGQNSIYVLEDLNLDLYEGEFVSIRGVSGTGKSTLLNLLGALDRADSGLIEVLGESLAKYQQRNKLNLYRAKMIGFIFQNHYLMHDFTVVENVMLPLLLRKKSRGEARKEAMDMLDQVGLVDRAHHYPNEISGGESQRVAVARAIVGQPPMILADEPTGNLDVKTTEKLIELLQRLQKERNLSILVVTHEDRLAMVAEKRYEMKAGKLNS